MRMRRGDDIDHYDCHHCDSISIFWLQREHVNVIELLGELVLLELLDDVQTGQVEDLPAPMRSEHSIS